MNELIFPAADEPGAKKPIEPTSRFVCFVLAEQPYGIAVGCVREVLRITDIAFVPGAPAACRGVINLRGRIVSVLDLRQMLGLTRGEDSVHSRILVVDHPDGALALQVDRVLDLLSVPDTQIESTPPVNPQAVPVAGIVSRASGPLFLLDPEQLISKINAKVAA